MMQVSIILVNYNTKVITNNCIDSIISKTRDIEYEIIVVDNGSTDGF
ncbi:GT2 family glycosyltransferase [Chryseobacterium ginsenosidimutans]|nr:GT2 family glycosyltransferase [Chryseobacterium ginsenosidimutans]